VEAQAPVLVHVLAVVTGAIASIVEPGRQGRAVVEGRFSVAHELVALQSVSMGELPREETSTAGRAHGSRDEALVESHPRAREPVHHRGHGRYAVAGVGAVDRVPTLVVRDDHDDVGSEGRGVAVGAICPDRDQGLETGGQGDDVDGCAGGTDGRGALIPDHRQGEPSGEARDRSLAGGGQGVDDGASRRTPDRPAAIEAHQRRLRDPGHAAPDLALAAPLRRQPAQVGSGVRVEERAEGEGCAVLDEGSGRPLEPGIADATSLGSQTNGLAIEDAGEQTPEGLRAGTVVGDLRSRRRREQSGGQRQPRDQPSSCPETHPSI
jgi:hypothetical protein